MLPILRKNLFLNSIKGNQLNFSPRFFCSVLENNPRTESQETIANAHDSKNPSTPSENSYIQKLVERGLKGNPTSFENRGFPLSVVRNPNEVDVKPGVWSPTSKRCGLIAKKLGMITLYDKNNIPLSCTILQVVDNQVLRVVREEQDSTQVAIQVGADDCLNLFSLSRSQKGEYAKAQMFPKKISKEFPVTPDAILPVGYQLDCSHFVPGQFVDVKAKTKGKGFAGVMKKHGMKGQPASHGQSLTHRTMGATGGCQDPGKVWKGKRMPGRMGGTMTTMQCLQVFRINLKYNLVIVSGSVPGPKNSYCFLRDSIKRPLQYLPKYNKTPQDIPFPSASLQFKSALPEEVEMDVQVEIPREKFPIHEVKFKKNQQKFHYFL
eukprot:Sdes_comp12238_c0_seq1m2975